MAKEINWDDDEQVEKYKEKQAKAADAAARAAEAKRTTNMGDDALLTEVVAKVTQVVDNAVNGDGVEISTLHLFIGNPLELGKKDAVTIVACRMSFEPKAPDSEIATRTKKDFQIFSDLVSEEFTGASCSGR
jgi:hypothetical protein